MQVVPGPQFLKTHPLLSHVTNPVPQHCISPRVSRTTEFAWAIVAIALWNSVDGGHESEEDSEQSLHGVLVFDSGFGTREVGS